MSADPNGEAPSVIELPAGESRAANRLTLLWVVAMLALFPTFVLLGMTLRGAQSNLLPMVPAERFYSILTMHGLGMVGLWYVAAMAGTCDVVRKYVRIHMWVNWVAFVGTVSGVVMLLAATLIGKYGPGWYFLYPFQLAALADADRDGRAMLASAALTGIGLGIGPALATAGGLGVYGTASVAFIASALAAVGALSIRSGSRA